MISYHRLSYIVENILNLTGGQTKQISDTSYSANTTRISKWEIRSEVNNKKYFKKLVYFICCKSTRFSVRNFIVRWLEKKIKNNS